MWRNMYCTYFGIASAGFVNAFLMHVYPDFKITTEFQLKMGVIFSGLSMMCLVIHLAKSLNTLTKS